MHPAEQPAGKSLASLPAESTMTVDWTKFVERVRRHQRYVLTSHVKPDCDALGSELGLSAVLESLGKQVRIVNADPVPQHLKFIDPQDRIEVLGQTVAAADLADREVVIILDTSSWQQLGAMADVVRTLRAQRLIIDHHVSQDDLGGELFKDTQAEATGALVVQAADALQAPLNLPAAEALFCAVATDTGWFRFASTTGNTFRLAGRLVDLGVQPAHLYNLLYEQETLARVQLSGEIFSRAQCELGGRLVHSAALRQDFEKTGALASDTENLINDMLAIYGTEVAVLFVEQPQGGVKASFRSRGPVDVSRVAEKFGGGGHRAAAGAFLNQPLATARDRVLDALRSAMR